MFKMYMVGGGGRKCAIPARSADMAKAKFKEIYGIRWQWIKWIN